MSRNLCATALLFIPLLAAMPVHRAHADDFFERQIRPVLIEQCYSCHSAHADPLKGDLRLDSAEGIAKGGESGEAAVVPGDPARSLLLDAIRHTNPDLKMPPKQALPAQVVADFERWIASGAAFPASVEPVDLMAKAREHWAFHAPQLPAVPSVADAAWPITDMDYFILARLEAEGLRPSPPADRRTLIRRLSFDLLGLPPSPEDVEAFVADTDPAAYDQLVERFLASPHYGERWGRHWLDVARYADTKGYVYGDREEVHFTHSHVYRDWVVNAINRDLPYDAFLRLQLAADSLAAETSPDDLAAMGFLTLGQRFLGVMPDIIDDRIDTVTRGLMGLTVSCARCHDHKFDPVPIEDYYSLYGVFSASSERTVPLHKEDLSNADYAAFAEEMQKREAALRDTFRAKSTELETRLRAQVDRYLAAVPGVAALPTDDFYEIRNAEDVNPTIVRRWAAYIERQGELDPVFGIWNQLKGIREENFPDAMERLLREPVRPAPPREGDVVFTTIVETQNRENAVVLAAIRASRPANFRELAHVYGQAFKVVNDALLERTAQGVESFDDPDREAIRRVLMDEGSPIRVTDGAIVDLEWMFDEPTRVELSKLQRDIDRWINTADPAPPYAVTLVDKPDAPAPKVFLRGSPANHGAEVPRQFPAILAGDKREPFASGSGRRELADAIASPGNPLTARVFVNRVWGWHFGAGIVDTPSDFGTRAGTPSHPALLDWLALNFIQEGWSLKALHRQMVRSATYRQASMATGGGEAHERDPANRLLSHFNAQRLDFESLRDAMLAASGQLDATLGGRPVDITAPPFPPRRTLYGRVDRQFLPPIYRVFDFPNPDMHAPQRAFTSVPQQALYLMNNPFVQGQARAFAAASAGDTDDRVQWLYRHAFQRKPTAEESERASDFIARAEAITPPPPPEPEPPAWSYGYGKFDAATGAMASFTLLPHFTGSAWQGGANWPDATLGWAQLTATGGHPGNDLEHAVIRRWTAPVSGIINIKGRIRHARAEGDGIMARVLSSRHGLLGQWFLHNTESDASFYGVSVEAGDTLDFVVDIREQLNSDEYLWSPVIAQATPEALAWNAETDFAGPFEAPPIPLTPWEKLAQVLLSSNEFLYVD